MHIPNNRQEYESIQNTMELLKTCIKEQRMICWEALYRVSQKECARLREGVPYVKVYLYNPKHLCPKLNG